MVKDRVGINVGPFSKEKVLLVNFFVTGVSFLNCKTEKKK
jgi:hypothetical protein